MQKITTATELRSAIIQLESKQAVEGIALKSEFHAAYESVRPINLVKNAFRQVAASEDIKDSILNTSVGLAAGYVSKVLFEGVSHGPLRKLLGTALMFGVTHAIAKNPEAVKSVGKKLFQMVMSRQDGSAYGHGRYGDKRG